MNDRGAASPRRLIEFVLKAAVLGALIWYLWPKLDMLRFEGAMRQTSTVAALVVFALFLAQAVLAAIRWYWIIARTGRPLALRDCIDAWFVGQCASQVLPALIGGDAARIWRVSGYGVPMSVAAVTVIADRFAGFVVLVALSIISLPVLAHRSIGGFVPREIFWIVSAMALALGVFYFCLRQVPKLSIMQNTPALRPVEEALERLPVDRRSLLVLGATSLGTNFTVILSGAILGSAINPAIDLAVCFGLLPIVTLLTFLPISIAGWGLREALMVGMFGLVDIPATDALALSIQLGLANLVLGLVGGIVWLTYPATRRSGAT